MKSYKGKKDLFYNKELGKDIWGLKQFNTRYAKTSKEREYHINNEITGEIKIPEIAQSVVNRMKRDTAIVRKVKRLYRDTCQACGVRVCSPDGDNAYSEAHHIHPLEDQGSDTIDNLIVVCPNCHKRAEKFFIDLDQRAIEDKHNINPESLAYHHDKFVGKSQP